MRLNTYAWPCFIITLLTFSCVQGGVLKPNDKVLIPAGSFFMGTPKSAINEKSNDKAALYGTVKPWYVDEWPQKKQTLKAFYIDRYEVTNLRYKQFVIQNNAAVPAHWIKNGYLLDRSILSIASTEKLRELAANRFRLDIDARQLDKNTLLDKIEAQQKDQDRLPVSRISWHQARQFCQWAGGRLPSEQEWEKAAKGPENNAFPWGNEWDSSRLNIGEHSRWESSVTPVGSYPKGQSHYGVMDMAGNVMEWVQDSYAPYIGSSYQSEQFKAQNKVVRGGGWGGLGHYVISHLYRTAYRFYLPATAQFNDVGFRCVKDVN